VERQRDVQTESAPEYPAKQRLLGDRAALSRVRLRRAVTLIALTLFLPGSAQLVAGNKRIGRIALRVWGGLWAISLLILLIGALSHSFVFHLAASGTFTFLLRAVLWGAAIGWTLLFFDAWRLGSPLDLASRPRLAVVGLNGVLCFSVAGALLFASHLVTVERDFIKAMFGDGEASEATHGRYNVLMLGGDSGVGRWGLRPDSLTVASIDADTGRTVLFGLPRNMTNFGFPDGSVLDKEFPRGFDCEGCYLNGLATWGYDHEDLFRRAADPGVEATIEGVEGITGLTINYYAMVNLEGFRNLVDAVGGLTLNVRDRIPVGGLGDDVTGYIEPGVRKLNGRETLWFARSREAADDYSRMARQKCVMNAMLQQLSPQTVILKFEKIAAASSALIKTDLPASELARFAELAMKSRSQKVSTVSFVPPLINTGDPNIRKIKKMVQEAIAKAEGSADASAGSGTGFTKKHRRSTTGGSLGNISQGYAANSSEDLSKSC
jgi:LCP family protein required for cell wall assembly